MKSVLDKQKSAQVIEFPKNNILYNAGETIAKESIKIQQSTLESNERIIKTDDKLIKSNEQLADNVKKLAETIKKQQEQFKEKARAVTETVQGRRQYKTIGDRVGDVKDKVKDFFTIRGFLDKTGISKRGSGGVMSEYLDRREDRQKYIKASSEIDPTVSKEDYAKRFDKQQIIQREINKTESIIKGYKDQGFTDRQIEQTKAGKKRETLAASIIKVDTRLQDSNNLVEKSNNQNNNTNNNNLVEKFNNNQNNNTNNNNLVEKVQPEGKKSNIIAFPLQASNRMYAKEKTEDEKIEKSTSQKLLDNSNTSEGENEAISRVERQIELLTQIEENTRPVGDKKKKEPEGKSLLGTLLDFFTNKFGVILASALSMGKTLAKGALGVGKSVLGKLGGEGMLGKVLGRTAAVAGGLYEGYTSFNEADEKVKSGEITQRQGTVEKGGAVGKGLGTTGGALAGGKLGAIIGTAILPGVGTAVGGIIGGIVGGLAGGKFGQEIGKIATDGALKLKEGFDEFIKKPFMEFFDKITNVFNEYIITPLKEYFAPVTDFFKKIKDQVFGFLEDFGIPEIGFTIPIINKKVSIGPFYPFRPKEGENRVASNASLDQSSSSGGESSKSNQNIVTSGKTEYSKEYLAKETPEQKVKRERLSKDTTSVVSMGEKVVDGKATYTQNLASFDPATGKSTISGDVGEREISKRAFNKIKSNAKEGGSADKVAEIVKEDDAYQQLGFLDKRKVDVGYAKATELLAAQKPAVEKTQTFLGKPVVAAPSTPAGATMQNADGTKRLMTTQEVASAKADMLNKTSMSPPTAASAVYNKSADNAGAAITPAPSSSSTVIAPTTNVNNNTTQIVRLPPRNQDVSLQTYMNSRYAY